jgi:hypothetical protein
LAGFSTIFKNDATGSQETDKLLDLFRNRSELKKEFAALRNEKYKLKDRIKFHEGATARVHQQLLHLENLLLDPEWAYNVVAFYQLRELAIHCKTQLSRFAEELKQQSERRVHNKVLVSWNERRKQKAAQLRSRLGEHRMTMQMLEDQLQSDRHKLMTMNGFVKLFRGRALAAEIDDIGTRIEAGRSQEREMLQAFNEIEQLDPPDHQGLDITAKRSINFMILSFAQQLYLNFQDHKLVDLAKEASEKSVGAINYGGKSECDVILERLERRKEEVEQDSDCAEILKYRSKLLAEHASFRHDDDAVPVPGSVATVFAIDPKGAIEQQDVDLLGENYFAIAKVLSR